MVSMMKASILLVLTIMTIVTCNPTNGKDAVQLALSALTLAKDQVLASMGEIDDHNPWIDCSQLYSNSADRIGRLMDNGATYDLRDARAWLSGALTSHATCISGLVERNVSMSRWRPADVDALLRKALMALPINRSFETKNQSRECNSTPLNSKILALWDASTQNADIVVAKDGSGNYMTINEAISALSRGHSGDRRVIVYVKSGVYYEYVEIARDLRNVMFVGDGIDKTIVTGNRNVPDGYTTYRSATFGVSADGFWARDMTFENTAGPEKHQAVAIRAESDHSVFYRCSFKGYQDTLFVHSQRQFYRDCQIYGTIDFIFGNAAVVIQNCDIFVRRPMAQQSNMITAQGRDDPGQTTGISVHDCRVRPAEDLEPVKGSFKTYLGRPWQKYSRSVFLKSDLDGFIHPEGWAKWNGHYALDTLYFGEYMNIGGGADTKGRVNWPGFHVLSDTNEASVFSVEEFIQGDSWLPESGVPFWAGI